MNLLNIKGYSMEIKCVDAYTSCLAISGVRGDYGLESTKVRTLDILKDEAGTEVGILSSISQRLEMNISRYGSQYQALRNGLYNLVGYKGTIESIKKVRKLNKDIDKVLGDTYLASLGTEVIPTIEGLSTKLPIFTAELKQLFSEINVYGITMLEELDSKIADFISNGDTRKAFIQLNSDIETANRFNKDAVAFIQRNINNTGNETATLSSIVGNNNEYKDSLKNIVDTINLFSNKDLSNIEKVVEKIEDRFDILIRVLKDKEENMTKESVEALVNTLDVLSKFLTNLSSIYYLHVRSLDLALTIKSLVK